MNPSERLNLVKMKLMDEGKVDINELSGEFNVSMMTIRRDLSLLEEQGEIIRTHGGAVMANPLISEVPFSKKENVNIKQKKRIAEKSASLISEGDTIILDSGTTTLEIAKLLKDRYGIKVITNDIIIAAQLMNSDIKVVVTGGELQQDVGALFGTQTYNFLKDIHVDILFLGSHAVDAKAGITSPTFEKSFIKQLMIKAAEKTWLVTDSSKLNKKAFSKVCKLEELTGFITDDDISKIDKETYSNYIKVL